MAKEAGCPVRLHLTGEKMNGGPPGVDKVRSWRDLESLYPEGTVSLHFHPDATGLNEGAWLNYLRQRGHDVTPYHYGDTRFWSGLRLGMDIAGPLRDRPVVPVRPRPDLTLPEGPYVTTQWDTGGREGDARRADPGVRAAALEELRGSGLEVVTIGGDAEDVRLRESLPHVLWTLANAEAHVGVDSGPMHLAAMVLPESALTVYAPRSGHSHHVARWIRWGATRKDPRP